MYLSIPNILWKMAWFAAQHGDTEQLRMLISIGVDIETKGGAPVLSTPLQVAAQHLDISSLKVLLLHGANTEVLDDLGRTALHVAAFEGRIRTVQLLLEYKANVLATAWDGKTALHFAVIKGRIDIIELLVSFGANVSIADYHGWTSLHYASENRPDVLYTLLQHNAIVIPKTKKGETPADVARKYGNSHISTILEDLERIECDCRRIE
jgi:ankyrin repeat protein